MSNSKSNREQSKKIEQSENQLSPRQARGQDFKVGKPNQTSSVPGHFQQGRNTREQKALFKEADNGRKPQPVPVPNKSVAPKAKRKKV